MRKLRLNLSHFYQKHLDGLTAMCCFQTCFTSLSSDSFMISYIPLNPSSETQFLLKIPRFLPDSIPQHYHSIIYQISEGCLPQTLSLSFPQTNQHCSQPKAFTSLSSQAKWRKPHFHYNPEEEILTPGWQLSTQDLEICII